MNFPRFSFFSGLSRKIYAAFLLTTIIPTAVVALVGVHFSLRALQQETIRNLDQEVTIRSQGLGRFFDQLSAQLLTMASDSKLNDVFAARTSGDQERIRAAAMRLEHDYATLTSYSRYVDQIRLLGADGQELVRADRRPEGVTIVPAQTLQFKGDRYYFRSTIGLEPGQLYISPLDLNVEFGKVEKPERPVIRVATPVADADGRKLGILVINLHADLLLEQVQQMADARKGMAFLLDASGHYMNRSAGGQSAGFVMDPVEKLNRLVPDSISRNLIAGDTSPDRADGWIMAQASIDFAREELPENLRGKWRLALAFPEHELLFAAINLTMLYSALLAALLVTATAGFVLSRRLLKPIGDMAQETAAIANGDFTRRVAVKGNDEIAALGEKFNVMAARLQQSAREGIAYQERLEAQVRERTHDLERERASLEAVIEHTADGIFSVDPSSRLRLVNPAGIHMLGAHEAQGKPLAAFWPQWPQIAADTSKGAIRCDLQLQDRVLSLTVAPTTAGFIVVARDVSQERRFLNEKRMLDRQMFQMEKLSTLGELAMGLAHEIGNPLAGMKAVAQAMQYEEDVPEGLMEALKRMEHEIDRLSGFLRSFHGFTAPQQLHADACQLDDVLDDVLFWIGKDANSKGIVIEQSGICELPALWADSNQLKQTLLNLVINAVHAMPQGGMLSLTANMVDGMARIEVCDTGEGIRAGAMSQIFEPFFTTRSEGSGLGLAIVRKIAEQHGAWISVVSTPGHGTCFTLNWPIYEKRHA
ncbi:MAG: ATP-binding protein [Telluria sp.]|nr:ATP-binding protein [Telluria sp.]